MPIYKQRKSKFWWCKFTAPDGRVIRQSTRTTDKALAEEFETKLKSEHYRQLKFGDKPEMSWREAVVKFISESDTKSPKDNISIFRLLDPFFGHLKLHEVHDRHILKLITERQKSGVKNSTINKSLEKIRALFNLAVKKWKVRCEVPYIQLLKTAKSCEMDFTQRGNFIVRSFKRPYESHGALYFGNGVEGSECGWVALGYD